MWYAVVDGVIWFETKAKSQKATNLRRDPKITVLIEDGHTYDTLRDSDGSEPVELEYRYVRPDGGIVWLRDQATLGKGQARARGLPGFFQHAVYGLPGKALQRARPLHRTGQ